MRIAVVFAAASVAFSSAPAFAHHSTAMFDMAKSQTVQGTIKELQWSNPHAWVQMVLANGQEWSFECGSPNTMSRQGWTKTSIKPGDKATVVMRPMKDGSPAGLLVSITLPNGKVLGSGASGPPPQAPAPTK